jgi:hypothetical protein
MTEALRWMDALHGKWTEVLGVSLIHAVRPSLPDSAVIGSCSWR